MSSMKIAHFIPIGQQTWLHRNLVGIIYGMSTMKIAHFVPIGQQTWPPHAILVSDWSISENPLKLLSHMNRNLVGSIYMYERFCIKFPQSRMKGEQHRLSGSSCDSQYVIFNGSESVLFFYRQFVYVLPSGIQLSRAEDGDPINQFNPAT